MKQQVASIIEDRLHGDGLPRAVIALAGFASALTFQATTFVKIQPQTLTLEVGERAQATVQVDQVADMYGFELHLSFDPSKVQLVDADLARAGTQLRPGDMYRLEDGFLVANRVDNQLGTALFAFTLLAPAEPLSGSGALVHLELQAISPGATGLHVEQAVLASPDGKALAFTALDGSLTIAGSDDQLPADAGADRQTENPAAEVDPGGRQPSEEAAAPSSSEDGSSSEASPGEAASAAAELQAAEAGALVEDEESGDPFQPMGYLMFGLALLAAVMVGLLIRWGLKQG